MSAMFVLGATVLAFGYSAHAALWRDDWPRATWWMLVAIFLSRGTAG